MNKNEIQEVISLFEQSTVAKLELEVETFKIKLEKFGATITQQHNAPSDSTSVKISNPFVENAQSASNEANNSYHIITAPLVGTFYNAQSQGDLPFVTVGSQVNAGDTLCIIEAMKVMNEIKADRAGTIKEIKVSNEDMVQFKQPLFIVA